MVSSIRLGNFIKCWGIITCVAITSMFYFPFEFRALPSMNTKKLMAAAALVILFFRMVNKRNITVDRNFIYLSILAGLVSFFGIVSVTFNNTEDYAYATYIMSFWVWWGAAYTVCTFIRWIHGHLTFQLVTNYLITVCVFQCIIALVMDTNKAFKSFINAIVFQQDLIFEGNVHRLYGIGASLDVAGMRFAAVLVMIIYLLANARFEKRWYEYLLYFTSFIVITIAGNIIARTTLVGTIMALLYLTYVTFHQGIHPEHNYFVLWRWIAGLIIISIPLMTYSYQNDSQMRKNMRFGFEGFFNWVEKGQFSYTSNDKLKTMYIWPDNAKTWIIGDGYFDNPYGNDPYYTGEITEGYYKNTDVGYLRFIYYFGTVGLVMFSLFMFKTGQICANQFPNKQLLFWMLLAVHFIIWSKVASDLFLVFALFLCFNDNEEDEYNLIEDEACLSDSRDV